MFKQKVQFPEPSTISSPFLKNVSLKRSKEISMDWIHSMMIISTIYEIGFAWLFRILESEIQSFDLISGNIHSWKRKALGRLPNVIDVCTQARTKNQTNTSKTKTNSFKNVFFHVANLTMLQKRAFSFCKFEKRFNRLRQIWLKIHWRWTPPLLQGGMFVFVDYFSFNTF